VVVAGGSGRRFGCLKQLQPLGGKRVLDWSVAAVSAAAGNCGVVVVVPEAESTRSDLPGNVLVAGGSTRSGSVRRGLDALPATASHVLIHDAARPLASQLLVNRVALALAEPGVLAVVPVVPVTDTIRSVDGGAVDRTRFVAVQTPQGFEIETLRAAHAAGAEATDDASLVDALGRPVVHVDGDPQNLKITEPSDLILAEGLLMEGMG